MRFKVSQFTAVAVFSFLTTISIVAGIDSMLRTERRAQYDVDRALAMTIGTCQLDRIDTDTIRTYRNNITIEFLRDTAFLALAAGEKDGDETRLTAHTGLTLFHLWQLSDQRAAGAFAALAALWLLLSFAFSGYRLQDTDTSPAPAAATSEIQPSSLSDAFSSERNGHPAAPQGIFLGNLTYVEARRSFYVGNTLIHLTPMQRNLMEMFMSAPDHTLSHQEICDRIWPRKPDASATLYTLMRRLKNVIEEPAAIRINCIRGEAYQLVVLPLGINDTEIGEEISQQNII
ncbi:MAG: helix-turn-helix domain-containing protein [Bacteroidaceae bacterium]|nr:helix-turn-helix domain-containing protein [Bacteroidaceae bacterium]